MAFLVPKTLWILKKRGYLFQAEANAETLSSEGTNEILLVRPLHRTYKVVANWIGWGP